MIDFFVPLGIGIVLGASFRYWFQGLKEMIEFKSPCCKKPMRQKYSYLREKMVHVCTYCNKEVI